jgi:hypothetical protein
LRQWKPAAKRPQVSIYRTRWLRYRANHPSHPEGLLSDDVHLASLEAKEVQPVTIPYPLNRLGFFPHSENALTEPYHSKASDPPVSIATTVNHKPMILLN